MPGRADVGTALLPAINQGCRSPTGSAMLGLERGDAGDEVLAGVHLREAAVLHSLSGMRNFFSMFPQFYGNREKQWMHSYKLYFGNELKSWNE